MLTLLLKGGGYAARVTWAEVAYQTSTAVTISCNVGNAVAAGNTASVSLYAARITWAEAQYQAVPNVTVPLNVGNAVAAGATASVSVYGAVRITWAEAQYQANPSVTLPMFVGNAVAGGPGGLFDLNTSVDFGAGNAAAAGSTATLTQYGARVTWGELAYQPNPNITLNCTTGNAVAGGPAGGFELATTIASAIGNATAAGGTFALTSVFAVQCFVGDATAAGQRCQVLPPLTVAPSATPGYAPKTRYRVRVGSRWLEVDPLDPMSVRRAYDAAQEDAQDAATQDVETPAAVAAQAVVVQPIKGPDYAGLAAEARRISEDIRKVYADALQTALIARLMREQIERDDEDDIAVLLASI